MDLGGGTGNFTQALAEAARVRRRVLCVDAFAEMLEKARGHGPWAALVWQVQLLLRQLPRCCGFGFSTWAQGPLSPAPAQLCAPGNGPPLALGKCCRVFPCAHALLSR